MASITGVRSLGASYPMNHIIHSRGCFTGCVLFFDVFWITYMNGKDENNSMGLQFIMTYHSADLSKLVLAFEIDLNLIQYQQLTMDKTDPHLFIYF